MSYTVYFTDPVTAVPAEEGESLLAVIRRADRTVNAPCGGHGTCGKCKVYVQRDGEAAFSEKLACRIFVHEDLTVKIPAAEEKISVLTDAAYGQERSGAIPVAEGYMVAFDIGTTTVVGYLLDGGSKSVLGARGIRNPQTAYGADVISRIDYALRQSPEPLTQSIRNALNTLTEELCAAHGIQPEKIMALSVVGNTAMHHLFLGLPTDRLAKLPYAPYRTERARLDPAEYGIRVDSNARLHVLPVIAGFVGADTVACLLAGNWTEREELSLLIDIGTNGEMVLGNRERMVVCSTAAGPAFEGAKISCGMRGAEGAIDHVRPNPINGKPEYHVIGGGEAKGVCGSGLLDLIALLVEREIIDETGLLETPEYELEGTGLKITRKDVREVQLAKAAIASGILLMAEYMGVSLKDIRTVELAGAFGSFMDIENVCAIGLLPKELKDRVRIVGNAAGEGAGLVLLDRENLERADRLARKAEFLELATMKHFQDTFVDALEF